MGGDGISIESSFIFPQYTLENGDVSQVLIENENDLTFLVDGENGMWEQDIRDVLFESRYTPDVINEVLAAKFKVGLATSNSSNSMLSAESDESGSKFVEGNASDILKERVKNMRILSFLSSLHL